MASIKEVPIEEKLWQLYQLQQIDSSIDRIQILKGELPGEVSDLEDDIAGLNTRLENLNDEMRELEEEMASRKNAKAMAKELITRYEKQQNNVKNNREFEALSKEIELQKLEIQLSEKKVNDALAKIDAKKVLTEETQSTIDQRLKDLKAKKKELDKIMEETEAEEAEQRKKSEKQAASVEPRLLSSYNRIRKSYRNGLAVVVVTRDSCGGCYARIPLQRQSEIRQKKRIITCEHCGRILVSFENKES